MAQGELARLDLRVADEMLTVWGTVVYTINEMGFAVRFFFGGLEEEDFIKAIRVLEAAAGNVYMSPALPVFFVALRLCAKAFP